MFRARCRKVLAETLPHVTHRNTPKARKGYEPSKRLCLCTAARYLKMSQSKGDDLDAASLPGKMAEAKLADAGTPGPVQSSTPKTSKSKGAQNPAKSKGPAGASKQMHTQAAPKGPPPAAMPLPDFVLERNRFFDELKKRYDEELAQKPKPEIKITLSPSSSEDSVLIGKAGETTPGQLLKHVPKEVAAEIVISKVDGKLWDLDRPLEQDSKVSYLSFKDKEGREVFWHSSAHVLGEAAEHEYGCRLSHGPPTAMGFFYDMALEEGRAVKETEWPSLEAKAKKFFKEKQPFERLEVSKDNLRKMFGYSKYKMHYIEKFVPDGESSTVYRNGSLVDLCQGPHIQNTKKIEAFKIMKNSSAYFLGDQSNDSLQRIHGVAFGKKEELKQWEHYLEEAKKRDHQEIGKNQKLFMFSQLSPGSPFLLPHGTRIFNALQNMLREAYWDRGYQEVQSPNMYNVELWKTSGHWDHYQDGMFKVHVKDETPADPRGQANAPGSKTAEVDKDKDIFGLKPMNCPGHCLMFRNEERSYRELPWRVADFGVLHRNEASGALTGLTRVRKFQQDDTHIFCTQEQIIQEIEGLFDFLSYVYGLFGFPFKLKFSTRPEDYMGSLETWNAAEDQLREALTKFRGNDWELNEGDGAFYGPKIDITISDALQREYQCATIQLDFQLPKNFKLEYMTSDSGGHKAAAAVAASPTNNESTPSATTTTNGEAPPTPATASTEKESGALAPGRARPVMIHRAIIGSFERFIAILTEHFAGKWPFWLSPRQILVVPVMKSAEDYVREIQSIFHRARMYVDVDLSGNTLQKKIRTGQLMQYNFIFGESEIFSSPECVFTLIFSRSDQQALEKFILNNLLVLIVTKRLGILYSARALSFPCSPSSALAPIFLGGEDKHKANTHPFFFLIHSGRSRRAKIPHRQHPQPRRSRHAETRRPGPAR
jgi:threonyl-tRNA synthetase